MPVFLDERSFAVLRAACARIVPGGDTVGADEAGVADYIDRLLGAFLVDPPAIWAGGPTSGRAGGLRGFEHFIPLSPAEELAWRTRIEGSGGRPERERLGPVAGWQEQYRQGLAALGDDFTDLAGEAQDERLRATPDFVALLHRHCCEGMYGAPEYGGNRGGVGWRAIGFPGDVQPRGWGDRAVSGP